MGDQSYIYKFTYNDLSHLESSVEMKFQYLRSSMPVILKALEEMAKQMPPVLLFIHSSFSRVPQKHLHQIISIRIQALEKKGKTEEGVDLIITFVPLSNRLGLQSLA